MSATNFNTKNDTFRKLMGNGLTYRIPRFQRDYSWTDEEWEDLWTDLVGTIRDGGEPAHYMGYLVLQSRDDKEFDVIDGQQRLTTLSLIVLAALKSMQALIDANVDPDDNRRRAEQIRQAYIGFLDPVSLVARTKLTLNRNNNNYYQTYLVPLGQLPQRNIRASETGLRKAFEWFEKKVRQFSESAGQDRGKALASFVEAMSDRLFFTVITVTDELNAYKVFETLNSRGVRLSATDLLKNYLFSVLHHQNQHEHEMNALDDRWENIVGRLGSESFPDFLRIHWNSRNPLVRQTELFKTIKANVKTRDKAFELIRNIETDVETYLAITQPELAGSPSPLSDSLVTLKLFNVTQPYPLLLAAKRLNGLTEMDFEKLVRACVVVSFRYNVIGSLSPSEQESAFNRAAVDLTQGNRTTINEAVKALAPIYPNDATFRAAFAEKSIATTNTRKRKIVRYLLCRIEKHLGDSGAVEFDSDSFNVEHVFPVNAGDGWNEFPPESAEALVYRLGNMTLLKSAANRDVGNSTYSEKRPVYEASAFALTRKLAEDHAEWTPERIGQRQQWMASQAIGIWKISQLS